MYAGLDIGSRTIGLVLFNNGQVTHSAVTATGVRPLDKCRELLDGREYRRLVVTGYGRHLAAEALGVDAVSEISAHAAGARHLFNDCGTLIDIGGQDSKAIMLAANGGVLKFEMNDRCAAGTGKFLEVMAGTLEMDIDALGGFALSADKAVQINSLCTVFAESEVVSLIARGEDASSIALGLHQAIATRVASMVRRVGVKNRVIFTGGAAHNKCLRELLSRRLEADITVPAEPQLVGALGAALIAMQAKNSVKVTEE